MAELIWIMLYGMLAVACLIISIMSFKEKGFLFNNGYIWASKQERETMNKKPHYRQSAIVFALCAALFVFLALECVLFTGWLWLIAVAFAVALLVYAISSSIKEQTK